MRFSQLYSLMFSLLVIEKPKLIKTICKWTHWNTCCHSLSPSTNSFTSTSILWILNELNMVVTSALDLLLSTCSLRQIMIIKFSGAIESSHVCNLQASETMNLGNSCHQEIVKIEDNSWHWFPLSSYLCFSRVAIILIASQFLGQCPAISGMSLKQVTIQLLYSTSLGLKLYIKFSNWLISFC